MIEKKEIIGKPIERIESHLKVKGEARYVAEFAPKNLAYGFPVLSTIAAGKIIDIDTKEAEKSVGVIAVITHKNAIKINTQNATGEVTGGNTAPKPVPVLQMTDIKFYGQQIAVVIAETYEQARFAAGLVKTKYEKSKPLTDLDVLKGGAYAPKKINANNETDTKRGDVGAAFDSAEFKVDETYETPIQHHNPMENHAAVAVWEADKLTVYYTSQNVAQAAKIIASTFNMPAEKVRVICPHIGGGFGSKGPVVSLVTLTVMAAQIVKRPVKISLPRQQMFTSVKFRQRDIQHVKLAANKDGKLTTLVHETVTHTSIDDEFVEQVGAMSRIMYDTPNSLVTHRVVRLNLQSPSFMRAPGEATGSFALESAMDELAYKLKIDPIEFRLKNEPAKDPETDKPWSSRSFVECVKFGAEKFGWKNRKQEPRANLKDNYYIGYGVAGGTYPARQQPTTASVKLTLNGDDVKAFVELAATDLGTGTYTIIAQTAADVLQLPIEKINVSIGDSALPPAPGSGGSVGAASFTNAVSEVCQKALQELSVKAKVQANGDFALADLLKMSNSKEFQTKTEAKQSEEAKKYSNHSFSANFAEVWVEKDLGIVRIKRQLAVVGAGRILNAKTARSQILGGNVWGASLALHEESMLDTRFGNFATRTLADYHVPVNLDIGTTEVYFVPEKDNIVNKLGVKGMGEIGIVGAGAAVANAIFNATGKRVRNVPITPDKLL